MFLLATYNVPINTDSMYTLQQYSKLMATWVDISIFTGQLKQLFRFHLA